MPDQSPSVWIDRINLAITIGLIVFIAIAGVYAHGAGSKAGWLAGVLAGYALYLAASSLVTGKILARLVFVSRRDDPFQYWLYFVLYLVGAGLLGAYAIFT